MARRVRFSWMNPSNLDTRSFRRSTTLWTSFFAQQNKTWYERENENVTASRLPGAGQHQPTTTEIIDFLLHYKCTPDRDRQLYLKFQIESFLRGIVDESLQNELQSTSIPRALLDERNNSSTTRTHLIGSTRPSKGPLNANTLYSELRRRVCQSRFVMAVAEELINKST